MLRNTFLQVLPSWNSTHGGSITFKFRTNEPDGLLLYNGAASNMGKVRLGDAVGVNIYCHKINYIMICND